MRSNETTDAKAKLERARGNGRVRPLDCKVRVDVAHLALKTRGIDPSSRSRSSWSLICAGLDIDGEQSWSMAGRPRACARSLPMCSVGAGGSAVAIAAVHGQRRCMECHAHRVVLSAHVTLLLGA